MSIIHEITRIIVFIWEALIHIWPLLIITIPLAVVIKSLDISHHVHRLFSQNIGLSIFLATLVGAVSPFCSCGIIPVITAMLTAGVPIAPVMSFWLASPSMDPEIFFLSVGALGLPLATARIIATFLMSISGGVIVHLLYGRESVDSFLLIKMRKNSSSESTLIKHELASSNGFHSSDRSTDNFSAVFPIVESCKNTNHVQEASGQGAFVYTAAHGTCGCSEVAVESETACCSIVTKPRAIDIKGNEVLNNVFSSTAFVLKFLLIAYFIEALIVFYLPESIMNVFLNTPKIISIVLASGVSVPLYTTNISALGLISGLLAKGMSGGAALSFLVGGATTTIPAMAAVYKIVDKRIFSVYVGTAITFSILSGLVFTLIEAFYL